MPSSNFTFRMPDDIRSELEKIAKQDDRKLSNLIIKILREYVQNNSNQESKD